MKILLVSATSFEIKPFIDMFAANAGDGTIASIRSGSHEMDLLITGVGMVATAYHLGKQLTRAGYDLALNAGIAGTFNPDFPPGTVVNVTEDEIADLGSLSASGFLSLFRMGLANPDQEPYRQGRLLSLPSGHRSIRENPVLLKLAEARGLTTNTIRTTEESLAWIRSISRADIETMEGAAFFYACNMSGLPSLQIRAISNFAGEPDKTKWQTRLAITNLNRCLAEFVQSAS